MLTAAGNLTNARALSGRVAVVRRGGCEFVDKATRVQQAGAIAMVIVNYDDQDVKAGSAEGGAADSITIPVVTVRHTVGAPLLAHAAQTADAFKHEQGNNPSHPKKRQRQKRLVEVDLAFGAARHTKTATPSPRSTEVELQDSLREQQPPRQYWETVEASWMRQGGWRADPRLRGRQVVVSSSRLKRAGVAGRTVGVVSGNSPAMEWEDNWPALSARAEILLTRQQMFTFAGYSHHYGGFWRFQDDKSDRAISYPYTEAGLQAIAPLWLASVLFCEAIPSDSTAPADTGSTCDSENSHLMDDDSSSEGEIELGDASDIDRDYAQPQDADRQQQVGSLHYDTSPLLSLNCSNTIAASRASALLRSLRSGWSGAALSLKLQYVVVDVFVVHTPSSTGA